MKGKGVGEKIASGKSHIITDVAQPSNAQSNIKTGSVFGGQVIV